MTQPTITLLTDFGTSDGYVGAMKGVILGLCPNARIIDIAHDIAAQDIRAGAIALANAAPYFPAGTIHVAVVDPGVGTERHALLVESAGGIFVGPDNGLLSLAARPPRALYRLDRSRWFRDRVSATFHGRDVFAPIAARRAAGTPPHVLGTPVDTMEILDLPKPVADARGGWKGAVIHVDRFGNVITNLPDPSDLSETASWAVELEGGRRVRVVSTYGAASTGELVALPGSSGLVELAVRDGSAAAVLGALAQRDTAVRLVPCADAGRG